MKNNHLGLHIDRFSYGKILWCLFKGHYTIITSASTHISITVCQWLLACVLIAIANHIDRLSYINEFIVYELHGYDNTIILCILKDDFVDANN